MRSVVPRSGYTRFFPILRVETLSYSCLGILFIDSQMYRLLLWRLLKVSKSITSFLSFVASLRFGWFYESSNLVTSHLRNSWQRGFKTSKSLFQPFFINVLLKIQFTAEVNPIRSLIWGFRCRYHLHTIITHHSSTSSVLERIYNQLYTPIIWRTAALDHHVCIYYENANDEDCVGETRNTPLELTKKEIILKNHILIMYLTIKIFVDFLRDNSTCWKERPRDW